MQLKADVIELGWLWHVAADFDLDLASLSLELAVDDIGAGEVSLELNTEIDGKQFSMLPFVVEHYITHGRLDDELLYQADNGQWFSLDTRSIRPLISTIVELFNKRSNSVHLPKSRMGVFNDLTESDISKLNASRVKDLSQTMLSAVDVSQLEVSSDFNATLRQYQLQGFRWLAHLYQCQLGGILADDMGLGKTIQSLAFLNYLHQTDSISAPSLVICPTSLVTNWVREAEKFAPSLNVLVLFGPLRHQHFERMMQADVVITTYPLMLRDNEHFLDKHFSAVLLDEAQQIKNPQSQVTQIAKKLSANAKFALTGTPLENHLGEIKSIMDFCVPGLLGTTAHFNRYFKHGIQIEAIVERSDELYRRMAPFMLRRTKEQVITELPPKTEISQLIALLPAQAQLYEAIRVSMEQKIQKLFVERGVSGSQIDFLDALLKLRQICCDPRILSSQLTEQQVKVSAKLNWLKQTLPEMLAEGRKVIIFSQFTKMLALLADELTTFGINYSLLTGQTSNRQQQIDNFQLGENNVFLISLKAGGVGLNLTAADTVIHFDPWWNPAAEKQATDRAYRMGQDKPVFVYKLIAKDTVEEKIAGMQQDKQLLAQSILDSAGKQQQQFSAEDMLGLFKTNMV